MSAVAIAELLSALSVDEETLYTILHSIMEENRRLKKQQATNQRKIMKLESRVEHLEAAVEKKEWLIEHCVLHIAETEIGRIKEHFKERELQVICEIELERTAWMAEKLAMKKKLSNEKHRVRQEKRISEFYRMKADEMAEERKA
ncbi:unnamed protein product [Caenorhabditis sp. 36 PRJEB53466]|nr:unnamed protein product [Caenorhabditis sp. 36 PRJEB53466]